MPKLSIIIVNYNTKSVLEKCLENLAELSINQSEIIVVDNASTDGSAESVDTKYSGWVKVVRAENNGLAAGYNLGMRNSSETDVFLFMGTDSFPKPGCIEGIRDFLFSRKDVGVATAKLTLRDGRLDMDAHRGFPTPWSALTHFCKLNKAFPKSKIFNSYFLGNRDMNSPHEIDLCISHFMMVKKSVFDKVGLWDQDFFVYGEDVDLCWRIKSMGFKIFYLPQFECLHYKGVSVGNRKETKDITKASEETKIRMKKESTRAMLLFYKKHMYAKYPWVVNKIVEAGIKIMESARK